MRTLILAASALALAACSAPNDDAMVDATDTVMTETDAGNPVAGIAAPTMAYNDAALSAALDAQSDEAKARYKFRNPQATLEFFGIAPGMSVGEALPGGGWYSKILLPYLGEGGELVGVNYPMDLWPNFGFMSEERLEQMKTWESDWPEQAADWNTAGADIDAYTFETLPADGSLDAFLFIRALHNLNRFEEGRFMDEALRAVNGALKPGGVVGVVQHEGPADSSDDWADGSNGYLRRADVIAAFERTGFVLDGSSDINANAADMPGEGDSVWRLPPSRRGVDDPEERARLDAIGETNRMTLRFRKPA